MKKIINGKKYDTNTAEEVGVYTNGCFSMDFAYFCETLYRKRTGEFFLHGNGGASSRYAQYVGNALTGSEQILPLTEAEAKAWAEDHLTGDEYESIFGEVEE